MNPIKCIIVDDEELARTLLTSYVQKIDRLELIGDYENGLQALSALEKNKVDLIFLDIQMPDLRGTELAKIIGNKTQIIFTTAYSEYALEGFELNAVDYLLKPITFERFLQAVQKVKSSNDDVDKDQAMTIKSGYDLYKAKYADIQYIESDSEYVNFHINGKKIMSHQSLKALEKELPTSMFMRVHRSFIINIAHVTSLKGRELIVGEKKIPVSNTYYEQVKDLLF
jgi:DNA-binding LytR/AlgR family response regulator